MSEREDVTLRDVSDSIRYGYTASATPDPTGTRFLRVTDIAPGWINWSGVPFCHIDEEDFDRYRLDVGDIVIARMGTIGVSAVIRERVRAVAASYLIRFRINRLLAEPEYIGYVLRSPAFLDFVWSHGGSGAVQPNINAQTLASFTFPLPDLHEQRRIAGLLGVLDDKIDLNRGMVATLEARGRLDFRRWSRMQEKAAFRPLHELCDILSGGTPPKSVPEFWAGDIPWISPKVMSDIHSDEPEYRVTAAAVGRGTRLAPRDSTLVMVRGMGLHERVRVSQAREDVTFNQDVKALVPRAIEPALLLFAVLDAQGALLGRVESSGHGTGVLPTQALADHLVPAPRPDARRRIADRLALLNDRIAVARSEARTLSAIRDRLLPRLLDGSVDPHALAPG